MAKTPKNTEVVAEEEGLQNMSQEQPASPEPVIVVTEDTTSGEEAKVSVVGKVDHSCRIGAYHVHIVAGAVSHLPKSVASQLSYAGIVYLK